MPGRLAAKPASALQLEAVYAPAGAWPGRSAPRAVPLTCGLAGHCGLRRYLFLTLRRTESA